MTDAVKYYRCPQCKAIVAAQDLGTPWAGVGWEMPFPLSGNARHRCRVAWEWAEPLSELPREAVLS